MDFDSSGDWDCFIIIKQRSGGIITNKGQKSRSFLAAPSKELAVILCSSCLTTTLWLPSMLRPYCHNVIHLCSHQRLPREAGITDHYASALKCLYLRRIFYSTKRTSTAASELAPACWHHQHIRPHTASQCPHPHTRPTHQHACVLYAVCGAGVWVC
jgi:hypothetical protein